MSYVWSNFCRFFSFFFFFSSRRRHTRCLSDWSSDVCSSDLDLAAVSVGGKSRRRNNLGSYTWYKRSGKRIDFMPAFHPLRNSQSQCSNRQSTVRIVDERRE